MFNPSEIHCWSIIKYKHIKRDGREETNNVQVAIDERNKRIGVFTRGEEVEQVFYHMEVSKYPVFKFKDNHLYVISNSQGQGFRLSFKSQDKANFISIMRRHAFISESPAKNSSAIERVHEWSKGPYSLSQPLMPPPRSPVARNLSASLSQEQFSRHSPSAVSFYSQPVYDPYSRPISSDGSLSSSIGSALSTLSDYTDISCSSITQCSSSSYHSSYSPVSFNSPISPLAPITPSPQPPPSDPPALPQLVDKSVQTDGISQLASDPQYVMECMRTLMKQNKFQLLVKRMRRQIREMSDSELQQLCQKTQPRPNENPS